MPAQTACPISEVDRALSAYVNSRQDTLRIRRTLSKYLTSTLRPVSASTQLQHLNHECPQNLSAANTNPPGLKDSRLEYLQALRARAKAQAKHNELQASLEQLRTRHVDDNPTQPEPEHDDNVTQGYVFLLRQRRRHAELQVIQESLEKLLSAKPSTPSSDPRDLVKRAIGEQPDVPAERLDNLSQTEDDQVSIFKLKQEVLEARASMERAQAAKIKAQDATPSAPSATLQSQVYALEQARNELVDWIQGELAKLEEESIFLEDASPIKRPVRNGASAAAPDTTNSAIDRASATAKIQASYDKYTAARANLLEAHVSLQNPAPATNSEGDSSTNDNNNNNNNNNNAVSPQTPVNANTDSVASKPTNPISKLLPYLSPLAHIATSERALTQRTVHLAAHLAAADQEAQEALVRLSGESHLLPAAGGSKEAAAWAKVAAEADAATEALVKERLDESAKEVAGVAMIVDLCSLQSRVLDTV
ncbi:hypothetical protein COCMIDRAFT_38533 [Bipolaris oryzae ATCC 44560]|uniref:Uncharacterized protein n=1 Tax=Bipolaris oryzae ATCC 44560 TaxID=930090 RepID=W6Z7I5_COCMI|nr:uncharacterized protein COCMIDRAFT_38533 [Bipolaris oryzae ATCC 44560]EUC43534.1 hypothetical protein COCMIDRAFT_38533 [Bipolaris oryzae ATCC 44560]